MTAYKPVNPGGSVIITKQYNLAFFDVNKNYISGVSASDKAGFRVVFVPKKARYMRMGIIKTYWNTTDIVINVGITARPTYKDDLAMDYEL